MSIGGPRLEAVLGLNDSGYRKGIGKAKTAAGSFAKDFKSKVGGSIAGVFGAVAVASLSKAAVDYGGKLTDLAAQTGVAFDALQKLDVAGAQTNLSIDEIGKFMSALATRVSDAGRGLTVYEDALGVLGVTMDNVKGKKVDEIFLAIARNVRDTKGSLKQTDAVMKIFGARGAKVIGSFNKDFAGLTESASGMLKLTKDQAEALTTAGDQWAVFKHQAIVAMGVILPELRRMLSLVTDLTNILGGAYVYAGAIGSGKGKDGAKKAFFNYAGALAQNESERGMALDRITAGREAGAVDSGPRLSQSAKFAQTFRPRNRGENPQRQQLILDTLREIRANTRDTAEATKEGIL
tara:strand:+ start:5054 stop:6103 length:1050 start_codon:yes stop_codon:yes gene_type:complete